MPRNQQILLDNRPQGEASTSNFKLVSTDTPALQDNEVLVRHHFMSLDPYMRGRMNDSKSYAASQPLGQVFQGGTAGEVVESRHPKYQPGQRRAARRPAQGGHHPCAAVALPRRGGYAGRDRLVWPGENHQPQGR